MVKLRRVYEYNCFESQKDLFDLKDHLGDDLYNDYMKIRNKIPKDQNDYRDFQKLKNLPIEDIRDFVDNFQSEVDKRKEAKKGAKKIYDDKDWLVYKITTYPAAVYYGSGTKWCITGRYLGHEGRGEEYFNDYIERRNLDGGYYFYINKKDPSEKYCVLQTKDKKIDSIWDATDIDRGSSTINLTINGITFPEIKEVSIPKYPLCIEGFFQSLNLGGEEVLEYYLENGFDINVTDKYGMSYLFKVLERVNRWGDIAKARKYIKILLEHGADPNIPNKRGKLVLQFVRDIKTANLLFEYGADPNIKNSHGENLLSIVQNPEIIKLLLNKGVDVNNQDSGGYTPLATHVDLENVEIIELLLEHGADPNISANNGYTPLYISLLTHSDDITELLLEYGADHNTKVDGMGMLEFAKKNNVDKSIIDLLKKYGAKE